MDHLLLAMDRRLLPVLLRSILLHQISLVPLLRKRRMLRLPAYRCLLVILRRLLQGLAPLRQERRCRSLASVQDRGLPEVLLTRGSSVNSLVFLQ